MDEFMIEKYTLNKELMKLYVKDCISKYNRIRPHYSCYMLTPEEMNKQNQIKMRTYKKKGLFQKGSSFFNSLCCSFLIVVIN